MEETMSRQDQNEKDRHIDMPGQQQGGQKAPGQQRQQPGQGGQQGDYKPGQNDQSRQNQDR
jgi:hypothetical protein